MITRSKSRQLRNSAAFLPATPVSTLWSLNGAFKKRLRKSTKRLSISRLEEKNDLIGLNNRLAVIIQRHRQLELEDSQLTVQVETPEGIRNLTPKTINLSIRQENSTIRKQLLDCQNKKSKSLIQLKETRKQVTKSNAIVKKNESQIAGLKKKINYLEDVIAARKNEFEKQESENAELFSKTQLQAFELNKLNEQITNLTKESETVAIQNAELTNKLESTSTELVSKTQIHYQEVNALRSFNQKKIEEIGEKLAKDFDSNVQEIIYSLQIEYEKQIEIGKAEQEESFKMKEDELLKQKDQAIIALKLKMNEVQFLEKSLTSVKSRVTVLEKEKTVLAKKVKGLEDKMKAEGEAVVKLRMDLEIEAGVIQAERVQVHNDYQKMIETNKVAVNNEIATYRKSLQGEKEK